MDFRTMEEMVEELRKTQEGYNKAVQLRIMDIKAEIEKLKEEYRKQTIEDDKGLGEFVIERAKKYFEGYFFEPGEVPKLVDDFYYLMNREVDKSKIIMLMVFGDCPIKISFLSNSIEISKLVLVFTIESLYMYTEEIESGQITKRKLVGAYNYNNIAGIDINKENNFKIMVKDDNGQVTGSYFLNDFIKCGTLFSDKELAMTDNDLYMALTQKKLDMTRNTRNQTLVRFSIDIDMTKNTRNQTVARNQTMARFLIDIIDFIAAQ